VYKLLHYDILQCRHLHISREYKTGSLRLRDAASMVIRPGGNRRLEEQSECTSREAVLRMRLTLNYSTNLFSYLRNDY
jgi:hypothetical protein